MSKRQSVGICLLGFTCIGIWTMLFVFLFQDAPIASEDHGQVRQQERSISVMKEPAARFINRMESKEIFTVSNVTVEINKMVFSETKVGDAISYGDGVSIDDLLEQLNLNR